MTSQLFENTTVTGILQPSNTLTDDGDYAFCAALVTLANGQVEVHQSKFTDKNACCKIHCPNPGTDEICQTYQSGDHVAPIA